MTSMNSTKLLMYAYDQASESADAIAKALGIKRISHQGSKFSGGPDYTVINWGCTSPPKSVLRSKVINSPLAVARAVNKKAFFAWCYGKANVVPWTTDPEEAKKWLAEGHKVVCRTKIAGKEGEGVTIVG